MASQKSQMLGLSELHHESAQNVPLLHNLPYSVQKGLLQKGE